MGNNWSSAALLKSLPLMDWALSKPINSEEWQHYCDFYQLPSTRTAEIKHYAGSVSIAGFHIVTQVWQPNEVTATAYIVHGLYDHIGLYSRLIDYCLSRGWRVITFDLPGHGLSSGERSAINSFQDYDQVFTKILTNICLHFSEPIHVFGQSTGGAIIINYLLKYAVDKDNSPFISVNLIAPLVRPYSWIKPKLLFPILSPFKSQLKRGTSTNSHDETFLNFVQNIDPLQTKHLPTSWVASMLNWNQFIEKKKPSDVAINIVQGTEDHSVKWKYNLTFLKKKFPNHSIQIIKHGRHHLVNESSEYQQPMWQFFDQALIE